MARNGRVFLLLMFSVIGSLLIFSFWAVRSNKAAGSFEINRVLLCDEVDEQMHPLRTGTVFEYGARQLCLWFDYSRSAGGDGVQVRWYFRNRAIHSEFIRLSAGDGARTFCLLLEDGSPLPKGSYSVQISLYDRIFSDVSFAISEQNRPHFQAVFAAQRAEKTLNPCVFGPFQEGDVFFRVFHSAVFPFHYLESSGRGDFLRFEITVTMPENILEKEDFSEQTPAASEQEPQAPFLEADGAAEESEAVQKPAPRPRHTFGHLANQLNPELRRIAKDLSVSGFSSLRKDDLIVAILRAQAEELNYRFGGGTLEILPEGYGFLRPKGLLPSDHDVYVSASQIRRFGLRNGDVIWGLVRPPRDSEHYEALLRVEMVNFSDPEAARRRPHFSAITPIFPDEMLILETDPKEISTRLVDLFAPIGKGQRALLVSPPKAGKTTLLKKIANAVTVNYPDIILMVLLIDERPEEVTDMARSVDGEIIASTFDRPADEHLRVANLALEKAKRLVEVGKDVVLLLDSITRLARASNLVVPPSGRTLSGGMDPAALYFPKRFFGAARNIEEGGSLTIIGTALVDTGSRMDEVIYEEFKGTGNMELHLSRKLSEQRIFPAMDITKSGTRREELLLSEDDLSRVWLLRRRIMNVDESGALNLIIDKLKQSPSNKDFLLTIKKS